MKKLLTLFLALNAISFNTTSCLDRFDNGAPTAKEFAISATSTITLISMGVMTCSAIDGLCNIWRVIANLPDEELRKIYVRAFMKDANIFASSAISTFVSLFLLKALTDNK